MPLLHSYDLASHVLGSTTPPSQTLENGSPNPNYVFWFRQDQQVLSRLFCSISESLLPQIIELSSAKEAWEKLAKIFSSSSRTQVQQIRKQLKHLSKVNDSIVVYMQRAKSFFDQL